MLRRNVLIFHLGALGDFVITFPIAMALARIMAQSRILYVTHASKGKLAEKAINVESIDIEQGWHELFSPDPKLPESGLKSLNGAQLILSFISKPNDLWSQNIAKLAPGAKLIHLDTRPPAEAEAPVPAEHITSSLLTQLEPHPMIRESVAQMLRAIQSRGIGVKRKPRGHVLIHPGAGAGKKCYPIARFLQVAKELQSQGIAARMVLGETEREQWPKSTLDQLGDLSPANPPTFCDLLEEILCCDVFIGNDSGPGHLAAISGVPSISLFGSNPTRWHPLGPAVQILQADGIENIDPGQIVEAVLTMRKASSPAPSQASSDDED